MSTCISYVIIDKFINLLPYLKFLNWEHICNNNMNFCQEVVLVFPLFQQLVSLTPS